MEPALSVIHRSLNGEAEAREFLETAFSSYALDASDSSNIKTYGGWNFIHGAMSEIERYETLHGLHRRNTDVQGVSLVGHARLLASMALGLARRSPLADQALIDECVKKSASSQASDEQRQWLKDVNFELREIVMGRIAATAFDFSFHRRSSGSVKSAFADRVVVDTFCAILSANAVSNGPAAIKHFSTEWIIPSSKSLPPFALGSVVLHLADEGAKMYAPAGTKDILQQLSVLVMSVTIGPMLAESVTGNISNAGAASYDDIAHVAAICLRAIDAWCTVTDLSLPQIKHICQKININLVSVLSDAMYSDSHNAIDALSQLLETHLIVSDDEAVSMGRMKQLRLILELDEQTFTSRFDSLQLKVIETKEMSGIIAELATAAGLQRFRFTERQNSGDHDVCRNLARIATSVAGAWLRTRADSSVQPESGIVALLLKAAAHPSVNTCGVALQTLPKLLDTQPDAVTDVLRTLQRRAIISFHQKPDGAISLAASDVCGVHFEEFQSFRRTALAEALLTCWKVDGVGYMNSCITAVEEFSAAQSRVDVSLGLEAALFCIEVVATDSLDSNAPYGYTSQLKRCFNAVSLKPPSLTASPLALARVCSLSKKYSRWFREVNNIRGAIDLILSVYSLAAASCVAQNGASDVEQESNVSPLSESTIALKEVLRQSTSDILLDGTVVSSLIHAWTVSYAILRHGGRLTYESRVALASGICHVVALLNDENEKIQSLQRLLAPTMEYLGVVHKASQCSKENMQANQEAYDKNLNSVAEEVDVLSDLFRSFSCATKTSGKDMESGCSTSSDAKPGMPPAVVNLAHQTWNTVGNVAKDFGNCEIVGSAIARYLADLLPPVVDEGLTAVEFKGIFEKVKVMSSAVDDTLIPAGSTCVFLEEVINLYGNTLQETSIKEVETSNSLSQFTYEIMVGMLQSWQGHMGDSWMKSSAKQGQGQDAMERQSPSPPQLEVESVSKDQLEAVLVFLPKLLVSCPSFALKLPSNSKPDLGKKDLLLTRSMEAAISCLSDSDASLVLAATAFITSLCHLLESRVVNVRNFASELISYHRSTMVHLIMKGCCGPYEVGVLEGVTDLLYLLVGLGDAAETESALVSSLQQEYFLMGDQCKSLTVGFLSSCAKKNTSVMDLRKYIEQTWQMHRAKDPETLPTSDVVLRFLERFGRDLQPRS